TAEAQAWGMIGIIVGYLGWSVWNRFGKPWLTTGIFCLVTYGLSIAIFALTTRSYTALKKCLLSARLLFIAETVTLPEYNKMRSKCLKRAGAI
ncbi:MAG TPA: hypothetical protein VJS37_01020, partial [Terriglobales bacterium]|nr:hypothetical protein [Terriglobales bacterium]